MTMFWKVLLPTVCSFALTVGIGLVLIPWLRRIKAGQSIREDGPRWHMSKQGTPTMGGLMFIAAITLVTVAFDMKNMLEGDLRSLIVLGFGILYGAIGFLDDFEKLKKKQNLGLTAIQKFALQLVVAIVLLLLLRLRGDINMSFYIPFVGVNWNVPAVVYFIIAAFIIVGCVNSVNLTDGVDGLATGVSIPVAICYVVIAFMWGQESIGIAAGALCGGLMGFLVFNFHPAKVFMGDTGSLFLGGVVCAMAFAIDMPFILIIIGLVYILETLSDIIQVVYFKLTHGKRFFKMAPLHHHFEMCGWNEYKVFAVFTLVSAVCAALGVYSAWLRG